MKLQIVRYSVLLLITTLLWGCVTTKRSKKEAGWLKTKVHDMNARYNGLFNAKELYKASITQLNGVHEDNYNQIISIYELGSEEDRKLVEEDMDVVIEKVVKVASLHEPSKWVDDCYVMMGKAQYLKGDYESAEETLEYFVEDFNPRDPTSRVYVSPDRKKSSKERKKEQVKERKIQQDERKKERKEKEKSRKEIAKEREKARKQADKERKQRNKDRKRGRSTSRPAKETPTPEVVPQDTPTEVATIDESIPLDEDQLYIEEKIREEQAREAAKKQVKNTAKGGFLKHKPAYYEGMLWLVKTQIERGKWIEANYFLDQLEKEPDVYESVRDEVPVVRADYFLRQKDYKNAIGALQYAIDNTKDKRLKGRMSYALAQAYQMNGQAAQAREAFAAVSDYKVDFEMEVNAQLSQLKNQWAAGSSSSEEVVRKLERMARQDRHRKYLGSVYSSMAEVQLASGNQEEALESFQLALSSSENKEIKSEIYYRLATLFLGKEQYEEAYVYYDSTLNLMAEKDPRYKATEIQAENLRDVAKNISIIEVKDSLLYLGSLPEDELDKIARKKAQEAWEKNQAAEQAGGVGDAFQVTTSVVSANSRFFAYNEASKTQGRKDFLTRWGDRPLEDDWRRSQKSSNTFDQDDADGEDENEVPDVLLSKEKEKFLRSIPRDDQSRELANEELEKAMFELGTSLRTLLYNHKRSNETLLKLLDRYPDSEHRAEAFYFIYLNYVDLGNQGQADSFKARLIREFPNSSYAKFLQNPTNSDALITAEREIEIWYEGAYELYEDGNYEATLARLDEGNKKYGTQHHMIAKYELLKALCFGSTKSKDDYMNALRGIILRFDGTDEQVYARELLRFLRGDQESFALGEVDEKLLDKYVVENDRLHYVLAIVYDTDGNKTNEVKKSIEGFNSKYFPDKKLRVTALVLNKEDKSYVILIRRFAGKDDAMEYYREASTRLNEFADQSKYSLDIYAANQKNYRKIIEESQVGAYRAFFDREYLSIGK